MATDLGMAYVQLMPSAKGISGKIQAELGPEADKAGDSAGRSAGSRLSGVMMKVIGAAGIGLAIKSAVTEGAALEQTIGGVETLFKDSASIVRGYADEAYRTTGMSANDYMENVTGFSASLLQSLGGDTKKAAEVSNRAMVDMADNSNKMGTSMESIQNAYSGFSKQNYTMLDNLKLGYGGTKKEMERLLKDATKLSGVKYNIDNLADVYNAIGVIQDGLGITGTTALEAEETISGSLSSMAASFKNVLGNLAIGEDIKPALNALASSVSTFLFGNLLPMVFNIVKELPGAIITLLQVGIPEIGKAILGLFSSMGLAEGLTEVTSTTVFDGLFSMFSTMVDVILENLPLILEQGVGIINSLVQGILSAIPGLTGQFAVLIGNLLYLMFNSLPLFLDAGIDIIFNLLDGIFDSFPEILEAFAVGFDYIMGVIVTQFPTFMKKGQEILYKLMTGLIEAAPKLFKAVLDLIATVLETIGSWLPDLLIMGGKLIIELGVGAIKQFPKFLAMIPQLLKDMLKYFIDFQKRMQQVGLDLIKGLWNGISDATSWLLDKIGGFVGNVMSGIKGFFGIKSPSRLLANEVGKFLPSGIALGVDGNTKPLLDTMKDLSLETVDAFDLEADSLTMSAGDLSNGTETKLDRLLRLLEAQNDNNKNYQVVLDTGVVAGELTPIINKNFGDEESNKERGM